MNVPSWVSEPDPWLPTRLEKRVGIEKSERDVLRATSRAMDRFLRQARAGILGQPSAVFAMDPVAVDFSGWPPVGVWEALVTDLIVPAVAQVLDASARTTAKLVDISTSTWRIAYLGMVQDRLRLWPDETFNYVRGFVAAAIADGANMNTLTKDLTELLQVLGTKDGKQAWTWQARRIARTETIGAFNGGAYYQALAEIEEDPDTDAQFKQWLATDDTRTRHTHNVADGQVQPIKSAFQVGGASLLFPGDPSGPADEVIQCRCTPLFLDQQEAEQQSARYRSISAPTV